MCDHGFGWRGSCMDSTNNGVSLTMDETQKALTQVGGVDIISFTPCKMAAVESAYELRDCTDVYIGNEDTGGYDYTRFMVGDLCTMLNDNPDISNLKLGEEIIRLMKKNFYKIFIADYPDIDRYVKIDTLLKARALISTSAIDTSKLEDIIINSDQFAKDLASEVDNHRFRFKLIRFFTQSFPPRFNRLYNWDVEFERFDVYDFAKKCRTFFFFNKPLRHSAKNLMNSIDEAVIGMFHNIFHPRAHGLTIYFPSDLSKYDDSYTTSELDFVDNTYWDEFLNIYLN
jgi:hypothetical protein